MVKLICHVSRLHSTKADMHDEICSYHLIDSPQTSTKSAVITRCDNTHQKWLSQLAGLPVSISHIRPNGHQPYVKTFWRRPQHLCRRFQEKLQIQTTSRPFQILCRSEILIHVWKPFSWPVHYVRTLYCNSIYFHVFLNSQNKLFSHFAKNKIYIVSFSIFTKLAYNPSDG
jgi:hypothetical protein